jgi:HPt (histidine-containing phosphotransfer) domain-containing protein
MSRSTVFDYQGSLERMGDDEQLFGEMVGFLFADTPRWLNELRNGLQRQDAALVQRSAHTLKSLAANFGGAAAVAAAAHVERIAREQRDLAAAAEALPALEAAIQDLEAALAPYHHPVSAPQS